MGSDECMEFIVCFASQDISGCNTSPVEGADSGDSALIYLCNALSRDDGAFTFPSLASGEYTVVSPSIFLSLE